MDILWLARAPGGVVLIRSGLEICQSAKVIFERNFSYKIISNIICKLEINCAHPGALYNGWLENTEAGFGLGASIIFRCHGEMLLSGNTSTVCQIDGRWRYPLPQCLAPCVVPTVSQGIVVPIEVKHSRR